MSVINYDLALIRCLQCIMEQQTAIELLLEAAKEPSFGETSSLKKAEESIKKAREYKAHLFKAVIPDEPK